MSNILKAAAALFLHKKLKDHAVQKAVEQTKREVDPADKFYIFVPENKKIEAFDGTASSQDFLAKIEILRSIIKTFGGTDQIQMELSHGTIIYFDMPRSSTKPMMKSLGKQFPKATLGEAKKFNT